MLWIGINLLIFAISFRIVQRASATLEAGSFGLGMFFRMSRVVVFSTFVAASTSGAEAALNLYELLLTITEFRNGNFDTVIGEIGAASNIGSALFNLNLIMSSVIILSGEIQISRKETLKAFLPYFVQTLLISIFAMDGVWTIYEMLWPIGIYFGYILVITTTMKGDDDLGDKPEDEESFSWIGLDHLLNLVLVRFPLGRGALFQFGSGGFGIVVGCFAIGWATENLAFAFAVPLFLVSIVFLAAMSSLPEFFAAFSSKSDGESGTSMATMSNVFDIMVVNLCLSIVAIVRSWYGLPAEVILPSSMSLSVWALPVSTLLTFVVYWTGNSRLTRKHGFLLLSLYMASLSFIAKVTGFI